MSSSMRPRLCALFFLEYLIKGSWFPLLGLYMSTRYLNFSPNESAWVFSTFGIASLTGMFYGGQLADRVVSQERLLAVSHLFGGLSILALAYVKTFWPFFAIMMIHCFFYVPTLSVANAIAFSNLNESRTDFGLLRLWGSAGWVAASWPLIFIPIDWSRVPSMEQMGGFFPWLGRAVVTLKTGEAMASAMTGSFYVGACASLLLAGLSLTLPRTPPTTKPREPFAPLQAIRLLAVPSLMMLYVVTFFDSLILYCYYIWTSRFLQSIGVPENWIAPAMSIGQIMEVVAMIFLGAILRRFGWRTTMILGILSQAVRFGVYAMGTPETLTLVLVVNVVHGFAYACFFATVFIYVDEKFPKEVRNSAQGLFNMMILGISQLVSNFFWYYVGEAVSTKAVVGGKTIATVNYHKLFLIPFVMSLFASALLAFFFRPETGIRSERVEGDQANS